MIYEHSHLLLCRHQQAGWRPRPYQSVCERRRRGSLEGVAFRYEMLQMPGLGIEDMMKYADNRPHSDPEEPDRR